MKRASLIIPIEMIFNGYKMKKKKKNPTTIGKLRKQYIFRHVPQVIP